MLAVTEQEIARRLAFDNPWWEDAGVRSVAGFPRRTYFAPFARLARDLSVRRAVLLMGPRRVGKTVLLRQFVEELLATGTAPGNVFFVSLDTPTYFGLGLEKLLQLFLDAGRTAPSSVVWVVFDEIQYLPSWEVHLKSLVDSYPSIRFVASGSAAAALRLKSAESGAGRFTEFLLPPLTFAEFLRFNGSLGALFGNDFDFSGDVDALNTAFVDYLNFGGFPEAVLTAGIRADFQRFVGSDIIDKVLLRDLPSLYGIDNTQDLNRLFAVLAYNTGRELNLDELASTSRIAKNTLRKYLEYLEAAFLVRRLYRVDEHARAFKRNMTFKVYLTNPCIRAALFGPVGPDDEAMGPLAETALVCQYAHSPVVDLLRYARWTKGEVDLVQLDRAGQKPAWAHEVKWSDRIATHASEAKSLMAFAATHDLTQPVLFSRTHRGTLDVDGRKLLVLPVSLEVALVGEVFVEDPARAGRHPRHEPPDASEGGSRSSGSD